MIKPVTTLLFLVVGLINFAPLMGVLGQVRLEALYGTDITSPDILLLLRHRAVLFGIVGGYIILSAFKPALRPTAAIFGYLSMVSYIALVGLDSTVNANLDRVMQIDIIAVILLTIAVALTRHKHKG